MGQGKEEKINWESVSMDKANFIYESVQKQLQGTLDSVDKIENKAFWLLTLAFSLFNFLTGILILYFKQLNLFVFPIGIYIGVLFFFACKLGDSFKTKGFDYPGNIPDNLIKKEVIEGETPMVLIGESQTYQERIDDNDTLVNEKAKKLNVAIKWTIITPAILLAIVMAVSIISFLKGGNFFVFWEVSLF